MNPPDQPPATPARPAADGTAASTARATALLRSPGSLRARLVALLLAAVALAALVQGGVAYRTALAEADAIFDYHMRQTALSLRAGLPLGAGPAAPPLPRGAGEDFDFIVQIWSAEGLRVYESSRHPSLPERAVLGFSDVAARGTQYRVFSLATPTQVIQVAQDHAARTRMARSLAWRTVAPIALAVPLLALAVWWVVGHALAPVQRVRRQLATRQPEALAEVDPTGLPDEVAPLVQELNALLARVREAFAAQQAFVADAAHELRSPLAALRLQAQALARAPDDAARAVAASRLTAGIDRAARLVDQLLVLAREEARAAGLAAAPGERMPPPPAGTAAAAQGAASPTGAAPPTGAAAPPDAGAAPARVDLAMLARELLAELAPQAEARGLPLTLDAAAPVTVPGQADALAIALRNLVDNALKYTPPGGAVRVTVAAAPGGGALLAVDDSGPGIAPADRPAALARFHRLPGTAAPGSGLGLAIVQVIARRHGATLVLDTAPGLGGLRAALQFPAPPRTAADSRPPAAAA